MIKELLEQRIRPSVQEDGGDIFYRYDEENELNTIQLLKFQTGSGISLFLFCIVLCW